MYKPISLKKHGIKNDYYFGKARDTIYSQENSPFLPKLKDVEHLIKGGKLIQIFGDFEASDKDARTATPKDFSALAFDLQGRLLAKIYIPVAIPDHAVYAIDAALVGHIDVKDLNKGFPEHYAATQIHDFFRSASRLDVDALKLTHVPHPGGKGHYAYPLEFLGDEVINLNIKPDGDKFCIDGEAIEQKIYGHWLPFNGEKYDDALLAHWSARLGFSNLFPSSRRTHSMVRSDVLVRSRWVWAFGPQDNTGLQLATRLHKRTKRAILGTRLEDIILNNTTAANRERGVKGGIRLYDNREFDVEKTHTSDYDTACTAALNFELRRIDPQGLQFIEEIDDADKYKKFLQGNAGYADRAPLGFVYYDQGLLTRGIGVLVATDDTFGDRRQAVMFNLGHDPKDIISLRNDQLRALLVQRNNDPVFITIELNKTVTVASFERAYMAGAGHNIAPEEYHRRAMMINNNRAFIQRVMENWYELTRPTPPTKVLTQRGQHEDSFSHYGEPKYYILKEAGHYRKEPKDIYKRRLHVWRTFNEFDRLINLATQGHAVEYSNAIEGISSYVERYNGVEKKLAKHQEHWRDPFALPPLVEDNLSLDDVRQHLWSVREKCMWARFSVYPDAWVMNERDQWQTWEKVIAMPFATRNRMWPKCEDEAGNNPHYRFKYERNPERYSIMTTALAFTTNKFYQTHGRTVKPVWWDNYFKISWEPARAWYEAYVTHAVQGPPNLDPSEHKTPSEVSQVQRITRIMQAAAAEMNAEYSRVLGTPMGQQRIAAHASYKAKRVREHVWTPQAMELMGFDPITRHPLPNPRFWVQPNKAYRVTVPDSMLETSNWHGIWGRYLLIAKSRDKCERDAFDKLDDPDASLVLVGKATGIVRLAAKAVCMRVIPPGADNNAAFEEARSVYATVGEKLGPHPFLLTFEQLTPIHQIQYRHAETQHVALPSLEWAGMVDTQAGGLPPPLSVRTGILVRDVGQPFSKGFIRLRRMQGGKETGDEFEGNIAKVSRIVVEDIAHMKDEEAWRFGKLSSSDLYSMWKRSFAELKIEGSQQKLWKIVLAGPIKKSTYTYRNTAELPVAIYAENMMAPFRSTSSRSSLEPSELGVAA